MNHAVRFCRIGDAMKIYLTAFTILSLSLSAFARKTDPRCDLGFDMKISEGFTESYTQFRGLFNETTRQMFAKGYDLKILEAAKAPNHMQLNYAPVSLKENSGTCTIVLSTNIQGKIDSAVASNEISNKAYKPVVDPVFDICWDLVIEQIKKIPDCPYKAQE